MPDNEIDPRQLARDTEIDRVYAEDDDAQIQANIEAYKKDLPGLLRDRKEHQKVAYYGATRVAIAPTFSKLDKILATKGLANKPNLFTISINSELVIESHSR